MKKILAKDKLLRPALKKISIKKFVLKSIFKNFNFFLLIRWNAFTLLKKWINKQNSEISAVNRCLKTTNKKRFNKLTRLSRQSFLKSIRFGYANGIKKSSW